MAEKNEAEQQISQLQLVEQNLQGLLTQRQQFQAQLIEVESALSELESTNEAYKIIGNIMVASNKENLKKDLKEKKETLTLRISTLEKQEKQLKEKAVKMRSEVLEKMKKND